MESISKFLIDKKIYTNSRVSTDEAPERSYLVRDLLEEFAKIEREKYRKLLSKLHGGILADQFNYGAMKEIEDILKLS